MQLEKIPDMIFGKNNLKFAHVQSGFELAFTPIDAIKGNTQTNKIK